MMSRYNVMTPFSMSPLSPAWSRPGPLQSAMDRLFQDFEAAFARPAPGASRRGRPRVQLRDRGDAITLVADLPGLRLDDLELTIEGETITLQASPQPRAIPEGFTPIRRERGHEALKWAFALPYPIDAGAASATLEQGRLSVVLPKAPEAQPRTIPVKAA